MLDDYLDQPAKVQLLTGELLPEGVRFWGHSPLGQELLWFGKNRKDTTEVECEFHVPYTAVAKIEVMRKN